MVGLFFEDINYAADGGLYAEMIENRSFEFVDCYGTVGDYYTKPDPGYGWSATQEHGTGRMEYVSGSPLDRVNPHYLRFTADHAGQGFANKAYDGVTLKKGESYHAVFYARCARYQGDLRVAVVKDRREIAAADVACVHAPEGTWQKWVRYEAASPRRKMCAARSSRFPLPSPAQWSLTSSPSCRRTPWRACSARICSSCSRASSPASCASPAAASSRGNTLENRYRWKESVGRPEHRRSNFNRWAVHETNPENGFHTCYSHYNQTLGLGYYEYFLLCEKIGAKPLPVLSVGLACQYSPMSSWRWTIRPSGVHPGRARSRGIRQWRRRHEVGRAARRDGPSRAVRLTMLGIGNEQWQTEKVDFFARYQAFEQAIHAKYPDIRLIGSAGPDITSERYEMAWKFYHENAPKKENFVYAVDEHYYVKPEWFYAHTDFYDEYPRDVKVFSGVCGPIRSTA